MIIFKESKVDSEKYWPMAYILSEKVQILCKAVDTKWYTRHDYCVWEVYMYSVKESINNLVSLKNLSAKVTKYMSVHFLGESQYILEVQEEKVTLNNLIFAYRAPLVPQMVKHLPAMQETQVQSLGKEDLLEKEMATHSNILAWKILWMEESARQ